MVNELNRPLPDPEEVARAAVAEPAPRLLEDYSEAIEILREKEFTFREIAEWLKAKFGIQADHNSVWRVYTKHMSDIDAHEEVEADEVLERDEALAEAEANGTLRVYYPPVAAATTEQEPKEPDSGEAEKAKPSKARKSKKG